MKKRFILLLIVILLVIVVVAGILFLREQKAAAALPTVAALPSETATLLSTETHTPTSTNTPTATITPSLTNTPTSTLTLTPTNTLSTLVLHVTVVNPDVTLEPVGAVEETETPTPLPTLDVPTPPIRVGQMPPGDVPSVGWFEHDVTSPAIVRQGKWESFTATYRSANKRYLYSDDDHARLSLRFLGAAVRVKYVAYFSYGVFQVQIDGQVRATIDSYYPRQADGRGNFLSTEVFGLTHGWHTLDIIRMGRKAPESTGTIVAIDAIDVYMNGPEPTAQPTAPPVTASLTPSPAPAQKVQLVAAPPTIQPTATIAPPSVIVVNFSLAYDLNGNKAIDPAEGVQGISVRLVTADTNKVIRSGYTNGEGFIHLEATTNSPLRLVVPYFNRFWDIPPGSSTMRITMLIPPANQPGIIP